MARARYRITEADRLIAYNYLRGKLDGDYRGRKDWYSARNDFMELSPTPEDLTLWCEKWLNREQWNQLKNAIRAARRRRRERREVPAKAVNVTLSGEAWAMLCELARRDELTPSDFLEQRLLGEWADS